MQNQVAEDWQEARTQAQPEKSGADEGQEYHQREHPRDEGKRQTATNVRTWKARLEEVRVKEGEAQADGQMDGDCRVEDIGGVFDHDVVGQPLEPHRVRLGARLRGGLDVCQREGNAVRDHGSNNHEYGGNKTGEDCSRQPALPQCRLRVQHGRYLLLRRGTAHTSPEPQALRALSRSACSPTCNRVLDLPPSAAMGQQY